MIRLRLAGILATKGWTAYRLHRESVTLPGLPITLSRAYRLARKDGKVERLEVGVLDRLCDLLVVTPGDLLEYRPDPGVAIRRYSRNALAWSLAEICEFCDQPFEASRRRNAKAGQRVCCGSPDCIRKRNRAAQRRHRDGAP